MNSHIEIYKKQIDDDFKEFPNSKRFFRLEKAWIRDVSHQVMKRKKYFVHDDRKEFRIQLYGYLDKKIKHSRKC